MVIKARLYAANNAGTGGVNIFDSTFAPIGIFATPPAISALGLVPFNVQGINGSVYVTYATTGLVALPRSPVFVRSDNLLRGGSG